MLDAGINYTVYTSMLRYLEVMQGSSSSHSSDVWSHGNQGSNIDQVACGMQADIARPDLGSVALSAGVAGVVLSSVLSPFELIKVSLPFAFSADVPA